MAVFLQRGRRPRAAETIERGPASRRTTSRRRYWTLLFLDFFERVIDGVLERKDRTLASAAREHDQIADAAIRESARAAYVCRAEFPQNGS